MRWISENIKKFNEGQDFYDTALVPCYSLRFAEEKEAELERIEGLIRRAHALDERLTGRLILFPPLVFYGGPGEAVSPVLAGVLAALKSFRHILFLPEGGELQEALVKALKPGGSGKVLSWEKDGEELVQEVLEAWRP